MAKSRTVEAISNLRAISSAQQIYFLTNGKYTADFRLLDISLPGTLSDDGTTLKTKLYTYALNANPNDSLPHAASNSGATHPSLYCQSKQNCIKLYCRALIDRNLTNKVCISLGGVYINSNAWNNYYNIGYTK
ncbi:MAG: type IV pilin-like G/H family protein [Elusimicrobiota bacterium]|nr:type IV pilin-like G/H family protein [Elusimicrobiota bacterium]